MNSYFNLESVPIIEDKIQMANATPSDEHSPEGQVPPPFLVKNKQEVEVEGGETSDEGLYSSRTSRSISTCNSEDELSITEGGGGERGGEGGEVDESDDEYTYEPPPYVPGEFEGPEKTMEVRFTPCNSTNETGHHPDGLRALSRAQLDRICTKARCGILSHIRNDYMDAYLLSESSMFVYRHKIMLKTCGTTTLLLALSVISQYAAELGLQMQWFEYSRKNLMFPDAQMTPHRSYNEEITFLSKHPAFFTSASSSSSSLGGGEGAGEMEMGAFVLGPLTGDHWLVYVAERREKDDTVALLPTAHLGISTSSSADADDGERREMMSHPHHYNYNYNYNHNHTRNDPPRSHEHAHGAVINIMLFGMDKDVAQTFYRATCEGSDGSGGSGGSGGGSDDSAIDRERAIGLLMSQKSGISSLYPPLFPSSQNHHQHQYDHHSFEPCGYSCNAVHNNTYTSVHVTPEPACSYVSYETNTCFADTTTSGSGGGSGSGSGSSGGGGGSGGGEAGVELVQRVVALFRPRTFMVTCWADTHTDIGTTTTASPFIAVPATGSGGGGGTGGGGEKGKKKEKEFPPSSTSSSSYIYRRDSSSCSYLNPRTGVYIAHYSLLPLTHPSLPVSSSPAHAHAASNSNTGTSG